MSFVLYEHPLNERIRNYLKLEQLFAQVDGCEINKIESHSQVFFTALFAILDTLERNDIRGELIRDLEKLEQNLVIWSKVPDVDNEALENNLRSTIALLSQIKVSTPKWCQLKNDKFLAGLKQRFAIQGGSSSFDLPQLKFWLNQDTEIHEKDIAYWLEQLTQISQSLALILKFIRQRAAFEVIETSNGFYQDNGDGIILLRIKVPSDIGYYPTISGSRLRYSIRFMLPCAENGRRYIDKPATFELSKC
jgi:cell division protein ZapD